MIRRTIRFRTVRQAALSVYEECIKVSGLIALAPMIAFDKMGIRAGGSSMGPAFAAWAFGFLLMLPITGPIMLAGILIGKIFVVQPLIEERMAKRQDAPLQKLPKYC